MKLRHFAPLIVACTATFLLLAYATVVTVAIPAIAADLHTDFAALQWVVDLYTLALAALLIVCGAVGDAIGLAAGYSWPGSRSSRWPPWPAGWHPGCGNSSRSGVRRGSAGRPCSRPRCR